MEKDVLEEKWKEKQWEPHRDKQKNHSLETRFEAGKNGLEVL